MQKTRILVVDDEVSLLFTIREILNGFDVTTFADANDALASLRAGNEYDILLIDFRLQTVSGLDILFEAKKLLKHYRALLITAYSNKELLEQVLNNDLIFKVVNKPFEPGKLIDNVNEAALDLKNEINSEEFLRNIKKQLEVFKTIASSMGSPDHVVVHTSSVMKEVLAQVDKYAKAQADVLILGESGTGKEVIANILHEKSNRKHKPIIKVNCSAIPENLFESELFGHTKGAFTGAMSDRPGKFQLAQGGTLFLDEISELPLTQQGKLLRAIENREISPIGSVETIKVDVRILFATNKNLELLVKNGQFREDLYFRINILNVILPPLRERKEDIALLACYFLDVIANKEGGVIKVFDKEALDKLLTFDFKGNVRELRNLVYKAYLLTENEFISKDDLCQNHSPSIEFTKTLFERSMPLVEFKENMEREFIEKQLSINNYNLTETARQLDVQVSNLSRKLKSLGISSQRPKS